jgi:hypothetical protein
MGRRYEDALEFLLDGVAESISDGRCKNLTPSRELRRRWALWERGVSNALRRWASKPAHARMMRVSVYVLLSAEKYAAYDVFQTLAESGVGIWDGRWNQYFVDSDNLENLQRHLKKWLGGAYMKMEQALEDEAYDQCGGDDPPRMML